MHEQPPHGERCSERCRVTPSGDSLTRNRLTRDGLTGDRICGLQSCDSRLFAPTADISTVVTSSLVRGAGDHLLSARGQPDAEPVREAQGA